MNILQGLQVDPADKEKQKEFLEEFKKLTEEQKQKLFVSSPSSRVRRSVDLFPPSFCLMWRDTWHVLVSREKRGGSGVQVIIESACKSIVEEYNRACSDLENLKKQQEKSPEEKRGRLENLIKKFVFFLPFLS